jgi:hypothetical protein
MYYGAVLAGLALGLETFWNRVLIPAWQTYDHLIPAGSHPVVDPLWSTESFTVVHDGAEATRVEKITDWVAASDVALRHLRVCWENRNGDYNCGECEKCIRTMVTLELAGVLGKCDVFARPLCYGEVAAAPLKGEAQEVLMQQNYEAALAANADPQLIRALRCCLHPGVVQRAKRELSRCARSMSRRLRYSGRCG